MKQWLAIALVLLTGCGGSSSTAAETKEIRIPKGAGGVGFLPLLRGGRGIACQSHGGRFFGEGPASFTRPMNISF